MADWARAEKQNRWPPRMEPKARARKLVRTAAEISKTLEYSSERGASMSCMMPKRQPRKKVGGKSMGRAPKANGPTHILANP